MDRDCFNMAVRILACDEIQWLIEPPVHNMDLRFLCKLIVIITYSHYHHHVSEPAVLTWNALHPKWRVKPDIKALATLLHSWPEININISSCHMILLPHAFHDLFMLFFIDKHRCRVSILNPITETMSKERYELKFQRYEIYLTEALGIAQPGWNADIYFWPRSYPDGIPRSHDRNLSGYFVFSFMLSWDGEKLVHPVCTDGYEMRKRFLLHLLKYHANEAKDNIPDVVQEYLKRFNRSYFG